MTRSKDEPDKFQVRARLNQDLVNLKALVGLEGPILETPHADYRWRLIVTPEQGVAINTALADDIDYSNFKNSVGQRPDQTSKLHGLHDIWSIHHGWQR